jgi:serine/threonine protein phosphatase 1
MCFFSILTLFMRTLVIGDIHGCYFALRTLEKAMQFTDEDHVILLGDLMDRGPSTRQVIDWVIKRRTRNARLTYLRGNHEWIMLWAREDPLWTKKWTDDYVGGHETLRSYSEGCQPAKLTDVPDEHWDIIENGSNSWFEDERFIYVHAHVDHALPMDQQGPDQLFWERFKSQPLHVSGKQIICGHTSMKNGEPKLKPHGICIDTYAHGGGWLTCLNVDTMSCYQANEKGEFRRMELEIVMNE